MLFLGAGSAGIGIANLIVTTMRNKELSQKDAAAHISLFDVDGLVEPSRQDLSPSQIKGAGQARATRLRELNFKLRHCPIQSRLPLNYSDVIY